MKPRSQPKRDRLKEAFYELASLIEHGAEWPDAQWKITKHYQLSPEEFDQVADRYDQQANH